MPVLVFYAMRRSVFKNNICDLQAKQYMLFYIYWDVSSGLKTAVPTMVPTDCFLFLKIVKKSTKYLELFRRQIFRENVYYIFKLLSVFIKTSFTDF